MASEVAKQAAKQGQGASGAHRFDPTLLREYDIRGIVGETLFAEDALAVGRAFGTVLVEGGAETVCLGYDGRLSSPDLAAALAEGLSSCGLEVWRIGQGPTPMLYFATTVLQAGGGIMVTGSHNPPSYNGFKMMKGREAFHGAAIRRLGEIAAAGAFKRRGPAGRIQDRLVLDRYVERLAKDYRGERELTVCWDAGNGAAGLAMTRLTQALPGRHILLNETVDGTFPAHHPDPTVPDNLKQLQAKVLETGADLGIAFDGDGDRIGVVDERARILWGDQLMVLLARDVLADRPGATIIADVKASQVLFDEIARAGGQPLMWRTGHSLIKSKMAETGAPLAGEMSGHIFFADRYYGYDDALYAAVRLLSVLARGPERLGDLRDRMPAVVNTPELRFPSTEERKFRVVEEVKMRLRQSGATVSDIDGVRVTTPDGWWLLRASNTQDVLVVRCEAHDEAGLERLKAQVVAALNESGVAAPDFSGKASAGH
ncbi:MAG: phosphoglucomutase/phosphomannomutase PgmG [Pseudomonadota bacterium]